MNVLTRNAEEIARRAGRGIQISHAAAKNYDPEKLLGLDQVEVTDDTFAVVENPEVEIIGAEEQEYQEGCLSVPGFYEDVSRPSNIRVKALDREGKAFEMEPDGLLAVCIQHEIDHLNGKLFVDYLSSLKRQRIKAKLEKLQRKQA